MASGLCWASACSWRSWRSSTAGDVSAWALPGAEDFGADRVRWTGEGLRELTGWIQALYALQHRQPTPITWTERKDGDAGEPAGAAVLPKYSR